MVNDDDDDDDNNGNIKDDKDDDDTNEMILYKFSLVSDGKDLSPIERTFMDENSRLFLAILLYPDDCTVSHWMDGYCEGTLEEPCRT